MEPEEQITPKAEPEDQPVLKLEPEKQPVLAVELDPEKQPVLKLPQPEMQPVLKLEPEMQPVLKQPPPEGQLSPEFKPNAQPPIEAAPKKQPSSKGQVEKQLSKGEVDKQVLELDSEKQPVLKLPQPGKQPVLKLEPEMQPVLKQPPREGQLSPELEPNAQPPIEAAPKKQPSSKGEVEKQPSSKGEPEKQPLHERQPSKQPATQEEPNTEQDQGATLSPDSPRHPLWKKVSPLLDSRAFAVEQYEFTEQQSALIEQYQVSPVAKRLMKILTTLIIVSGLLTTSSYPAFTSNIYKSSVVETGTPIVDDENLEWWFRALNGISFVLSLLCVFSCTAGILLLQFVEMFDLPSQCPENLQAEVRFLLRNPRLNTRGNKNITFVASLSWVSFLLSLCFALAASIVAAVKVIGWKVSGGVALGIALICSATVLVLFYLYTRKRSYVDAPPGSRKPTEASSSLPCFFEAGSLAYALNAKAGLRNADFEAINKLL